MYIIFHLLIRFSVFARQRRQTVSGRNSVTTVNPMPKIKPIPPPRRKSVASTSSSDLKAITIEREPSSNGLTQSRSAIINDAPTEIQPETETNGTNNNNNNNNDTNNTTQEKESKKGSWFGSLRRKKKTSVTNTSPTTSDSSENE
jgi:hypothetical protein